MALVNEHTSLCMKSELDLFAMPPTQTCIEEGSIVEYLPVAAVTEDGPIDFVIPPSGEDFIDCANTWLYVVAKITAPNGDNLPDGEQVGPVNLFMHSLFSQVDIKLNDKLITSSSNTYPYRAFIETFLNYGRDAKESQLSSALWYKDTPGEHMESHDPAANGPNAGLSKRSAHTTRSRAVEMIARLHSDIFFQEKLLLNGVGMHVRMVRSSDKFALMCADGGVAYKIKITKAVLRTRKVRLSPDVFLAQSNALETSNAVYNLDRVEVKSLTVAQGARDANQQIFQGQVPTRVVVGCIDSDAYNGRYAKNPFNFKHYHISKVSLQVDGKEQMQPIQCDFDNHQAVAAYMNMFLTNGRAFRDTGLDLTRDEYVVGGYTLFCFDLTPDFSEPSDHLNLIKTGSVRLGINFGQALLQTINILIYAEFENVLEIDRNRNVHIDYLG
jgi:hypothetical protein